MKKLKTLAKHFINSPMQLSTLAVIANLLEGSMITVKNGQDVLLATNMPANDLLQLITTLCCLRLLQLFIKDDAKKKKEATEPSEVTPS